jgi:hypothetical protein
VVTILGARNVTNLSNPACSFAGELHRKPGAGWCDEHSR